MSATSSEVATGSAVWRTQCIGEHRQLIERTDHIPDRARRDPRLERGGRQLRVTQQHLDDADIDTVLQQVGRKAVPQRVRPDPLGDARRVRCLGGDTVYLSVADRFEVMLSGEQPAVRMHHALTANPLAAEPDSARRVARLQSKSHLTQREAEAVDTSIRDVAAKTAPNSEGMDLRFANAATTPNAEATEKICGDTVDFVNVSFLEKGARTARAVGRVAYRNETPLGTGFLIGNGLFITNHHVIPSRALTGQLAIDFDYELDLVGNRRSVTRFLMDL
jgi:hypothetical protein